MSYLRPQSRSHTASPIQNATPTLGPLGGNAQLAASLLEGVQLPGPGTPLGFESLGPRLSGGELNMSSPSVAAGLHLGELRAGPTASDFHAGPEGMSLGDARFGLLMRDGAFGMQTEDASAGLSFGSIDRSAAIEGAGVNWGPEGLDLSLDRIQAPGTHLEDLAGHAQVGDSRIDGSLGSFHQGPNANDMRATFGPNGFDMSMGSAGWNGMAINNADVRAQTPLGDLHAMGSYRRGTSVEGAHISGDLSGVQGGLDSLGFGGHLVSNAGFTLDTAHGSGSAHIGRADTATRLEGLAFDATSGGLNTSLERLQTGGFTLEDASTSLTTEHGSMDASLGRLTTMTTAEGAFLNVNGGGLQTGFDRLEGGGFTLDDAAFAAETEFGSMSMSAGNISTANSMEGARINLGAEGLQADLAALDYANLSMSDVAAQMQSGDFSAHAEVGELLMNNAFLRDGHASIDANGLDLRAGELGYSSFRGEDLAGGSELEGIYRTTAGASDAHYLNATMRDAYIGMNDTSLTAGFQDLQASYAGGDNAHLGLNLGDGALDASLAAGRLDVGNLGIGDAGLRVDGDGLDARLSDVSASGIQARDAAATLSMMDGAAAANLSAGELDILDATVGDASLVADRDGVRAGISDAAVQLLGVQDGSAGLSVNGEEVLGIAGSGSADVGVGDARADIGLDSLDLSVDDLGGRVAMEDTSVSVFGHEMALPDAAAALNVDARAAADLSEGAVGAGVNFAGTGVEIAGYGVELGDWAQMGADVNLSEGNLDVNLFGNNIDVDGAVSSGYNATRNAVRDGWNWMFGG